MELANDLDEKLGHLMYHEVSGKHAKVSTFQKMINNCQDDGGALVIGKPGDKIEGHVLPKAWWRRNWLEHACPAGCIWFVGNMNIVWCTAKCLVSCLSTKSFAEVYSRFLPNPCGHLEGTYDIPLAIMEWMSFICLAKCVLCREEDRPWFWIQGGSMAQYRQHWVRRLIPPFGTARVWGHQGTENEAHS